MSGESSKKPFKATVQTTLNFPTLYTKDKGKEKSKEVEDTNLINEEKQKATTQQTLLKFLSVNSSIKKKTNKRSFNDINSESNNESESANNESESEDNESESEEREFGI